MTAMQKFVAEIRASFGPDVDIDARRLAAAMEETFRAMLLELIRQSDRE